MYSKSVSLQDLERAYHIPEFVQLACRFKSHIAVKNSSAEFNAKSIMGMMSLDPREGCLKIVAEGEDEQEAAEALAAFLTRKS